MAVFFITEEGSIESRFWNEGGLWEGYQVFPKDSASPDGGIAVVSRNSDHVQLFWIGQFGSIETAFWTARSKKWKREALVPKWRAADRSRVAALSRHDGHMEVWWVDNRGAIWSIAWRGSWEYWLELTEYGTASATGSLIACASLKRRTSEHTKRGPAVHDLSDDAKPVMHIFWTCPKGGTSHGSKSGTSAWEFTWAWEGRSAGTPHCLAAMANDKITGVDVWIVMDDLRIVHAVGERGPKPASKGYIQPWLEDSSWNFIRDVVVADDGTLTQSSAIACVSRAPGWKEVLWSGPDGVLHGIEKRGEDSNQLRYSRAGTVRAAGLLTALTRDPTEAEVFGLAPDGALLAGGIVGKVIKKGLLVGGSSVDRKPEKVTPLTSG
jgi:hypothetical protein